MYSSRIVKLERVANRQRSYHNNDIRQASMLVSEKKPFIEQNVSDSVSPTTFLL